MEIPYGRRPASPPLGSDDPRRLNTVVKHRHARAKLRRGVYAGAVACAAALAATIPAGPASAGTWQADDLTGDTGSPWSGGATPMGYQTDFRGQGTIARVVYANIGEGDSGGDVMELSRSATSSWSSADLTSITGAPLAASAPWGYVTSLSGQGLVARVVYRDVTGHIDEFSNNGGRWQWADLTVHGHGPAAAGAPMGYTTNLRGQGPVARVVYLGQDGDVHELSVNGAHRDWADADLSVIAINGGSGRGAAGPMGYVTSLSGQGPVARVVYRDTSNHVRELWCSGGQWHADDLTGRTHAPAAAGAPMGYTTNLSGQGPVARVVYLTENRHIEELSTPGGSWQKADLTVFAGAPISYYSPFAYITQLSGEPQIARVVYTNISDGHIDELRATSATSGWHVFDLSEDAGGAPVAVYPPTAYTTNLSGEGPKARVLYGTLTGPGEIPRVIELSSAS